MFFLRLNFFLLLSIIFFFPFVITSTLVFLFIDKKIFFIQKRIGLNRRVFNFIKFSSMKNNNDQDNLSIYENHRINSVGRFIRKFHLDEIPQIFNILRGEMNLIGPRPWSIAHDQIYRKQLENKSYFLKKYFERSMVRPGIIGLAQLKNLNQETKKSLTKRLRYDLYFIHNQSFALNIYIALSTIIKILKSFFK